MDISIIIVNYNVREFLRGALESVRRSLEAGKISGEVIVVDNASRDHSVEMVRESFPEVQVIASKENLGFGKANNLAMRQAKGEFLLILNPDTILAEETLRVMVDFMRAHPEAGIAGCKLLNADGSFQISCRRGFPTPWASFTKLFGLSSVFPNSPLFSQYNLTYLSTDQTYEIDALAGAFMIMSQSAFKATGGFDEDFFMYGEDIDLSYRVKQAGFKVFYVHTTSTIHFKGESTRRSSINEIKVFYEAMHIFVRKHYGSNVLFTFLLRLGIILRSSVAFFKKHRGAFVLVAGDIAATLFSILAVSKYYFHYWLGLPREDYPWVLIVPAMLVPLVNSIAGAYSLGERRSSKPLLFAAPAIVILLSSATYFFKEIPSSRSLVLTITAASLVAMMLFRYILKFVDRVRYGGEGSARPAFKQTLIAGTTAESVRIAELLISSAFSKRYHLVGFITDDLSQIGKEVVKGISVKGDLGMLARIIREEKISQVIFPAEAFSYSQMLSAMQAVSADELGREVSFNVVPKASDVLLSKSKIELIHPAESNETLALMPLEYNIQKISHRFAKRIFDLIGSVAALPFVLIGSIFSKSVAAVSGELLDVIKGKRSLVGIKATNSSQPLAKIGVVTLCDVSGRPASGYLRTEDIEQLNLYYARHHSLTMDIEILFRKLFTNKSV